MPTLTTGGRLPPVIAFHNRHIAYYEARSSSIARFPLLFTKAAPIIRSDLVATLGIDLPYLVIYLPTETQPPRGISKEWDMSLGCKSCHLHFTPGFNPRRAKQGAPQAPKHHCQPVGRSQGLRASPPCIHLLPTSPSRLEYRFHSRPCAKIPLFSRGRSGRLTYPVDKHHTLGVSSSFVSYRIHSSL
jgi:hypothetical protein